MHIEAFGWFTSALASLPERRRVLEIGSRNINGSLRDAFPYFPGPARYIGIDVAPGPCVDAVASGADYEPPWAPDTVLCAEVLEHVPDAEAEAICQNALRVLEPGGYLLLSAAAEPRAPHSAIHGGKPEPGEFYRNVTARHLRDWLRGFDCLKGSVHPRGDIYVLARKP